jgi:hypothetical protein
MFSGPEKGPTMSSVSVQDWPISAGADWSPAAGEPLSITQPWLVNGSVVDLTGYTALLKIRTAPTDAAPWLSITSTPNANGSVVTPNTTAGTVTIILSSLDTSLLPANLGPLTYDLEVVSPAGVKRVLQSGRAFVFPNGLS